MPSYRNMNNEWADVRDRPLRMNPKAKDLRAQEQWIPLSAR